MEKNEHVYYWAWSEADNRGISYFANNSARKFRVWRSAIRGKDEPITEPMSRDEAIACCERIIKLTGGRQL